MGKKARHRDNVAFQDYHQDSNKVYKRQVKEMKPNIEAYEKAKVAAVERAAASGNLEVVETEDGELVAVDKNGTFYSSADSTDFVGNKPEHAAVDRLVSDLRKAEESRMRKRRDRGKGDDDPDVTYINDKNKQFNQKLARFYNKVGIFFVMLRTFANVCISTLLRYGTVSKEALRCESNSMAHSRALISILPSSIVSQMSEGYILYYKIIHPAILPTTSLFARPCLPETLSPR